MFLIVVRHMSFPLLKQLPTMFVVACMPSSKSPVSQPVLLGACWTWPQAHPLPSALSLCHVSRAFTLALRPFPASRHTRWLYALATFQTESSLPKALSAVRASFPTWWPCFRCTFYINLRQGTNSKQHRRMARVCCWERSTDVQGIQGRRQHHCGQLQSSHRRRCHDFAGQAWLGACHTPCQQKGPASLRE